MSKTPQPPKGENVETMTYPIPGKPTAGTRGTANLQTGSIPAVIVGGHSTEAPLPTLTGTFSVGDDKNVSTPVSG